MTHSGTFLSFLQALRNESVTKLLAEPRLVTVSGKPARFLSGGEQAMPVPAGLGQVGIQFQEFGTTLNFLPIVLGDGRIHLEVDPEVSSLNAAFGTTIQGTVVPGQSVQRVHTTVDLEPGQTLVIGGLIQHDVTGDDVEGAGAGRPALRRGGLPHRVVHRGRNRIAGAGDAAPGRSDVVRSVAEIPARPGDAHPRRL